MDVITKCRGRHNDDMRTLHTILIQLGQKCYSLNSFPQTLREEVKKKVKKVERGYIESVRYQTQRHQEPGGLTTKMSEHVCHRSHTGENPDRLKTTLQHSYESYVSFYFV